MAGNDINVIIEAILKDDQFKKGVKSVTKEMADSEKQTKKTESAFNKFKGNFVKFAAAAAAAFVAVKKSLDFVSAFGKFDAAVTQTKTQFGKNADDIIKKLKAVSGGTLSNLEIITNANRLMALGVTKDVDQMAKLLEFAQLRARALGLETNQVFSSLVEGIGKGTTRVFDDLGIATEGWETYAKATGQAFNSQFILNQTLELASKELQGGLGAATVGEEIQSLKADFQDLTVVLGKSLLPIFKALAPIVKGVFDVFSNLPGPVRTSTVALGLLTPVAIALYAAMGPIGLAIGAVTIGLITLGKVAADSKKIGVAEKSILSLSEKFEKSAASTGKSAEKIRAQIEALRKEASAIDTGVAPGGRGTQSVAEASKKRLETLNKNILELERLINKEQAKPPPTTAKQEIDIEAQKIEELKKLVGGYYQFIDEKIKQRLVDEEAQYRQELKGAAGNAKAIEFVEKEHSKRVKEIRVEAYQQTKDQIAGVLKGLTDLMGDEFQSFARIVSGLADVVITAFTNPIAAALKGLELIFGEAKKIQEDMKKIAEETIDISQKMIRDIQLARTQARIDTLEAELGKVGEKFDALTEEEKALQSFRDAEEKKRLKGLADAGDEEARLELAALNSREAANKMRLEEEAKLREELDKEKRKAFQTEKQLKIMELVLAEASAIASVPRLLLSDSDEKLIASYVAYYSALRAQIATASYAKGTESVPQTGLANIHKNERIIPAEMNMPGISNENFVAAALRGLSLGNQSSVVNNSGGNTTIEKMTVMANNPSQFGEQMNISSRLGGRTHRR